MKPLQRLVGLYHKWEKIEECKSTFYIIVIMITILMGVTFFTANYSLYKTKEAQWNEYDQFLLDINYNPFELHKWCYVNLDIVEYDNMPWWNYSVQDILDIRVCSLEEETSFKWAILLNNINKYTTALKIYGDREYEVGVLFFMYEEYKWYYSTHTKIVFAFYESNYRANDIRTLCDSFMPGWNVAYEHYPEGFVLEVYPK